MMIFEKGQKYTKESQDGIWVDFEKNTWLFLIKDEVWQDEEISRAERSDVTIHFVSKGILDGFLLEIYDCLEPSDIPVALEDAGAELIASLEDDKDYDYEIVLIDHNNDIKAVRDGGFTKANSRILRQHFKKRMNDRFSDADLDHAYAKLEQKYQPYELEQFALFQQKN